MPGDESHPSWVCGLKPIFCEEVMPGDESHPSWVCGLKREFAMNHDLKQYVTPFVGVWIETQKADFGRLPRIVTPFVGVWIET